MKPYRRTVQYYETDRMGVAHHANYLHWMEEARIDFMQQLGFPYEEMEVRDVLSPVKSLSCDYRRPVTFQDEVAVNVSVVDFNGVVMTIGYEMVNAGTGESIFTGRSEHCFLNREGHFVRMRREMPEFCKAVETLMQDQKLEKEQ